MGHGWPGRRPHGGQVGLLQTWAAMFAEAEVQAAEFDARLRDHGTSGR